MYRLLPCARVVACGRVVRGEAAVSSDSRLPTGTVTLLLGDVEGSTRLWQRSSPEARAVMSDIDGVVSDLVSKFDGARPVEQGEGDSFVAAFDRASKAVACALELQIRLSDLPVQLRLGLYTGELDVRDEGRYDGPTIIRAARLRDLGHGGQVIVASSTRDVVQDALPEGCDLIDLGTHRLRDLDRPERVFQLAHPSLPSRFPPLRSPELVQDNLPARLTTFVGRLNELAEVQHLVETKRLVTLTGAGGCGKTRLAIEACARMGDAFPDGVWFCDLGPLADPDSLAQTLCTVVRARPETHPTDVEAACARLRTWRALVVLDNCEHLVAACAMLVESVLQECPDVRILTTSREPLGVEGELSWRVPSLGAPERRDDGNPDALASFDAVRLFVERASQARPGFALTADNAAAVAEICSRLDGIPLAIELAAARVRVISADRIASGLSDRFRLLGRGARTLLPRQQTLEASVAWSHDLLPAQQKALFRRLSVFAGGFTLEATEHVATGDAIESAEVLDLLSQLVDRSLVVAVDTTRETRYRMLETIRQFARDRLVDSGEAPGVAGRHLDWYLGWLPAALQTPGRGEPGMLAVVEDEYDNIRVASEWALTDGRQEAGLRLVAELWSYWILGPAAKRFREGRQWLEALLAAGPVDATVRGYGLCALSVVAVYLGDEEVSSSAAAEAIRLSEDSSDTGLRIRALIQAGVVGSPLDPAKTLGHLEEGIRLARESDDRFMLARGLLVLSIVKSALGDAWSAYATYQETLRVALESGNVVVAIAATPMTEVLAWFFGERTNEDILRLGSLLTAEGSKPLGEHWLVPGLGLFSQVMLVLGDVAEAEVYARRSLALAESNGTEEGAFFGRINLARIEVSRGNFAEAHALIDEAERSMGQTLVVDPGRGAAELRSTRALALWASGDSAGAAALLGAPRERISIFSSPLPLYVPGLVARAAGEIDDAESFTTYVLQWLAEMRSDICAADVLELTACLRCDVGADAEAQRLFGAAAASRERSGTVRQLEMQATVERELEGLRQRLDPDGFAALWAEGKSLGLEDAIALALRGRGPRQRPRAGWDSLTPTEQKVVALVAEGLSNPQIAEKLFISRRTVSTHVSHVFGKLGVSSRAELAAEATKRGVA